jgi:hypothetical protein
MMLEMQVPDDDDELWSHFNRLPSRCMLAPRPVNLVVPHHWRSERRTPIGV